MTWKFETSGFDGQCTLFGVNIFQYRWRDCRETAAVIDPHYGTEKVFHVYEVEINAVKITLVVRLVEPFIFIQIYRLYL